ncbi:hypothetical protein CEXT_311271 [Caerostris extrusa]|uniref:Uncharacterized protein n=1 Tax=Caerostris extrusa TaxID=172846 RepID=A0AAV4NVR1_CAEEX|nr:hypothetical protein CEXT_311271 [Caerostris extrusa]
MNLNLPCGQKRCLLLEMASMRFSYIQNNASFASNVSHFYHKAAAENRKQKPKKRRDLFSSSFPPSFHPPTTCALLPKLHSTRA